MADRYDIYVLSGTGTSTHPFHTTAKEAPVATNAVVTDADATGDQTVLGDVSFDSFTTTDVSLGSLLYTGYLTAGGISGIVGEDEGGNYYLLVPAGTTGVAGTTFAYTASHGGVVATEWNINAATPYCFVAGTMILTPSGERPIESLAAGDLVSTVGGSAKPVRWLGKTIVATSFADPVRMMPVRIKAGALADNVPSRDLLVSPGHAVGVADVLVHANALVNGVTIVRETAMPTFFTYYHLETDSHDLLVAENTPAESFLEAVSDIRLENFPERAALLTQAATVEMDLPRVKAVRHLPADLRAMINARAGVTEAALLVAA